MQGLLCLLKGHLRLQLSATPDGMLQYRCIRCHKFVGLKFHSIRTKWVDEPKDTA